MKWTEPPTFEAVIVVVYALSGLIVASLLAVWAMIAESKRVNAVIAEHATTADVDSPPDSQAMARNL